jgi:hypothetical protein
MVVLAVLVVFAVMLSVLSLMLLSAVIRRLREHEQVLVGLTRTEPPVAPLLPVGERIGAFSAVTTEGEPLSRDTLQPGTLVGFFDPGCDACHEQLPDFVARALELAGGRRQALAVVGDGDDTDDLVRRLRDAVRVTVEPRRGPLQQAFGVRMFPAFCSLGDDQVIMAHGYNEEHVTAAAR